MSPFAVRFLAGLLAVLALAVGIDNLERALANPDEGRYSEISREMAASGDWVTPRLNGIKYFEKPPLQYWATAVAFKLFGISEYTARLYIWLCGLGALVLTGYTASRLGVTSGTGLAAMLALLASPYYMAMAGVVTLDTGLTFWTTVTLCAYLLAERPGIRAGLHRAWMLVAWAGIALAVLSKGLIGLVIPAAAVGLHCIVQRDFAPLRRMEWVRGGLLALAIAAPWFVVVSMRNPEFARFFFVHEHFERFLTTAHRRTEPWWFFLPIVAVGFLPWVAALPSALRHAWRRPARPGEVAPFRFAVIWAVFVVAFFSASGSKLPAYILPAFPAFALALGLYLAEARPVKLGWQASVGVLIAIGLAIAAVRLPASARDDWTRAMYTNAQPYAYAGAALFAFAAVAGAWLLFRARRWTALVVMAAAMVMVVDCIEDAYEQLEARQSGRQVAAKMRPAIAPGTRLYSVRYYEQSVPFYLGRTLTLVDYVDEFETGLKSEPALAIPRVQDFPAEWLRPGDAVAIMHPDTFQALRGSGLPMQVIHEDPRRVVVRKP